MAFKFDRLTNDLILDDDSLNIVLDVDATVQYLRAKLRTFLGEWFLDQSIGIPYFEEIFRKDFDPIIVDSDFKTAILTTPGISELETFVLSLDGESRRLKLEFSARTPKGVVVNFNEVIP